ncbi:MAG TPA: hypothetical protein VH234_02835, partial [Candidatus Saccharimonadales bacterium]|nr:hypothetical protein [Candidatus Saccharimonadales bacterium]
TPALVSAGTTNTPSTDKLLVLWPVYAIAATLVISFWLGERREKHILGADGKGQSPPPFGVAPRPAA